MELIYHEQPSSNPAIQDQGSFGGLFFSGVTAGSGLSGHLCCPALWPLSSPASSGRTSRISIFFTRESLKVDGFTCTGLTALHLEHSGKCETLSAVPARLTPCLSLALCLPHHLPSLLPKGWREVQQQRHKEALDQGLHSLPSPKSSEAFSCILFTSFLCQTYLDENRVSWKGRKKEIT